MQQQLRQEMWKYWNIFDSSLLSSLFRIDPPPRSKTNFEYCSESKQSLYKIWELGWNGKCVIPYHNIMIRKIPLPSPNWVSGLFHVWSSKAEQNIRSFVGVWSGRLSGGHLHFTFRIKNYIFLCRESHYTYFVDIHIMYEYEHHTQWWTEIDM